MRFARSHAAAGILQLSPSSKPASRFSMFAATFTCSRATEGNITVHAGEHRDNDGVLMVDTGSAAMTDRVVAELRKLMQEKPVRYLVNTSADPDHAGGNAVLSKGHGSRGEGGNAPGAAGSECLCTRQRPGSTQRAEAHLPALGLPTMTFERLKDFTFNGEGVQIFSEARAHTDGDSIVYFRGSKCD